MKTKKTLKWIVISLFLTGLIYYVYPEKPLEEHAKISSIVINKSERQMMVYDGDKLLKTYEVSLGKSPVGDKQLEGDNKTPEGKYKLQLKLGLGISKYHRSLKVSYPTDEEKKMGKKGDDICIHGLDPRFSLIGKFHRWYDWTAGCIAVTDHEIDQIYKAAKVGIPITINP